MIFPLKRRSVLPGFGLTMGYTLLYLSIIVLLPLSALFFKTSTLTWKAFIATVTEPRVVASYKLTFSASLIAAMINSFFGFIVAWTLVRYEFPFKKVVDAFVDLPFALPTAVSGIALTAVYAKTGWIGSILEIWNTSALRQSFESGYEPFHNWLIESSWLSWVTIVLPSNLAIEAAFSPLGITIALTFIGLPFVVRTLQPALEDLDPELEEAAGSLGANRFQTFYRVILPALLPALITGFALSFARALGEYGSVVFIAGNMPMKTEITALLIIVKLEQYSYAGATALAVVMLLASFCILLVINLVQWLTARRFGKGV